MNNGARLFWKINLLKDEVDFLCVFLLGKDYVDRFFKNNVSCVGVVNLAKKNEKNRQQKSEKNKSKRVSSITRKKKRKKNRISENLIAVSMVFFGVFTALCFNTDSMGILGKGIRFLFLGIFGKLAMVLSIIILVLGAVRLVYYNRFSLQSIPRSLIVLSFLDLSLLYGRVNLNSMPGGKYQLSILGRLFSDSAEGLGIGVIPYSLTYVFHRFMGRWGLVLFILILTLFILGFYFGVGPNRMVGALQMFFSSVHGIFSKLKNTISDFILEEEDDEEEDIDSSFGVLSVNEEEDILKKNYSLKPLNKESYTREERKRNLFDIFFDEENFSTEEKEEVGENQSDSEVSSSEKTTSSIKATHWSDACNDVDDFHLQPTSSHSFEYNDLNELVMTKKKTENLDQFICQEGEDVAGNQAHQSNSKKNDSKNTIKTEGILPKEENVSLKEDAKISLSMQEPSSNNKETEERAEYILPPYWLLDEHKRNASANNMVEKNAKLVEDTLKIFAVEAKVVNVSTGPTITRYELQPQAGTKVSKILNLSDDLSLALAAQSIRIEAPIPGKSLIGIEVSNEVSEMVGFKSVVSDKEFRQIASKVSFVLGKDVAGKTQISDLSKMPHLLVAGSTGSGKSVCINTLICSILYHAKPDEVKFIMIDPKMVELSIYNGIPHLMMPVVTDMKKAPYALSWAVDEMNKRYKIFAENKVKDINGYNHKMPEDKMSSIVIIVDELADLMLVSPKEVEDSICRLAQMARACGIHLVIATQRPSVDVITGLIKANIPSRIAFAVSSQTDSRTILDIGGAEKLLGKGDMLYYPIGMSKPLRVQGAFISEKEVGNIVTFINEQNISKEIETSDTLSLIEEKIQFQEEKEGTDSLYDEVVSFAIEQGKISTSLVQRKFRIGYNRASRIIDCMEENGVVAQSDGVRPRNVLINKDEITGRTVDGEGLE